MHFYDKQALSSLRKSLSQCQQGKGQVILINGGMASGKTELLQQLTEVVVDAQALQLGATGSRTESAIRMGIVWQLFNSAPLPPDIPDRVARLLGDGEMEPTAPEGAPAGVGHSDVRVMHGLCSILLELAQRQPVVICVDDLHFADDASLQILNYLCRRIRSAGIMLVLTEWVRPDLLRSPFRTEITRYPHHRITLQRLPVPGIADLLTEPLGDRAEADRLAPSYHALTGGNLLLLSALLEDDQSRGPSAGGPVAGAAYRQAVLNCLQRWDPHLIEIACALAILDGEATPTMIGRLLSMKTDAVEQLLDILTRGGLLVGGRLRHSEIVSAIQATLSENLARLHTLVAELLYESGADEGDIARHLVKGGTALGPWAQQVLRHAARQALVDDEPEFATGALELALFDCEDDADRLSVQSALTQVAWWVNPSAAARYFPPLHDALSEGRLAPHDALPVIRQLLWQGNVGPATEHMEAMTSALGPGGSRTLAELRLSYEWIYGASSQRRDVSPSPRTGLAGSSRPAPDPRTRDRTSLYTLWAQGPSEDLVNSAEHILQGRLIDTMPEAGAMALLLLDHAGHRKRATHWLHVLDAEAKRQGAITWQAMLNGVGADIALRRGELATADSRARGALDLLYAQSWGVLVGFPLSTAVSAATAMGQHERAAELLEHVVPDAMFETVFGLRYLHAGGHHHLATGRPFAAKADFERCGELMRKWDIDIPDLVPWRSDLAQVHLAIGQRRKARELLTEQFDRLGQGGDARLRGATGRLLARVSPPERRTVILTEAVELLERGEDHLELAWALADMSQVHQERGELGEARLFARRADQEAKACHAEVSAVLHRRRTADRQPANLPAPRARGAGAREEAGRVPLSDAERKVAALAAFGHSNREIGQRLYITVSTVEQHLTRVYRKLSVRKREDLPRLLLPG